MDHTFVICAYKESRYLEECIESLEAQVLKTNIIIETSTPCAYIMDIAKKHNVEVYVNDGEGGITQDWNYGLAQINTKYATIAHQDDIYEPDYLKKIYARISEIEEKNENVIIAFSDYFEIRNGEKVVDNKILKIKTMMLSPLNSKRRQGKVFWRRRVLSLGDPICCPAVTFNLDAIEKPVFHNYFRSCEDWEAWEKLSKKKGYFAFVPERLMGHRIHEESTTTEIIQDNGRVRENYEMYLKFWPKPIAKLINYFYTDAEKSNEI